MYTGMAETAGRRWLPKKAVGSVVKCTYEHETGEWSVSVLLGRVARPMRFEAKELAKTKSALLGPAAPFAKGDLVVSKRSRGRGGQGAGRGQGLPADVHAFPKEDCVGLVLGVRFMWDTADKEATG